MENKDQLKQEINADDDQSKQTNVYADDDDEFLQLIDKTYRDEDLVEWNPKLPPVNDENEPGFLGKAVELPPEQQELAKERFKENEFNVVVSEMLSLNRTWGDNRSSE